MIKAKKVFVNVSNSSVKKNKWMRQFEKETLTLKVIHSLYDVLYQYRTWIIIQVNVCTSRTCTISQLIFYLILFSISSVAFELSSTNGRWLVVRLWRVNFTHYKVYKLASFKFSVQNRCANCAFNLQIYSVNFRQIRVVQNCRWHS